MANTTSLPKNMLIDDFPEELRLEVAKQIALEENHATMYPSEMAGQVIRNNNNNDTNNSLLVFVSRHPILESHREIRHSYQNALRSLVLDAQIPRVIMHVLNFDFAPLINEFSTSSLRMLAHLASSSHSISRSDSPSTPTSLSIEATKVTSLQS